MTRDLRKDEPYLCYPDFDFQVCCATAGDCFARYLVRMAEMRESLRIVAQAIENVPAGPVNVPIGDRTTLPNKRMVYSTIEGTISHFELVMSNRGFEVPNEESYAAIEVAQRRVGFLSGRRRDRRGVSGPLPAAVVHPFCVVSVLDPRTHAERYRGGAGKFEHHRRRVGSLK